MGEKRSWTKKSKYHIMDFYRFYRNNIEKKSIYDIPYKKYHEVLYRGNQLYTEALMQGKSIRPLVGLGEFQVFKYRQTEKRRVVDWAAWHKDGTYKFIENEHSSGYRFFVKWIKYRPLKNIRSYRFSMILYAKKKLAEAIFAGLDAPVHSQTPARRIKVNKEGK